MKKTLIDIIVILTIIRVWLWIYNWYNEPVATILHQDQNWIHTTECNRSIRSISHTAYDDVADCLEDKLWLERKTDVDKAVEKLIEAWTLAWTLALPVEVSLEVVISTGSN